MPPKARGPAIRIAALLLALCSAPAAADVAAGVAAYRRSDFTTALREFQGSAQHDDVRALNYLGIMHADGIGTPRNDEQAVAMFSKAALLGFPEAMANLARMHAAGRGGPQDNKAAVSAYRAAARAGFEPAIVRMAKIYETGELGEAPDAALAREWRARLPGQAPPVPAAPPTVAALAPNLSETVTVPPPAEPGQAVAAATLPEVAAITQNTIESVTVTMQSGRILIGVRTKMPLAAVPAGIVATTPPWIAFDFPHTVTGLGRNLEVGNGDLRSVDLIQGGGRTRMVLILRSRMRHDVNVDGRDLLITLAAIE